MNLTFDADKHEFRVGGVVVPSVTQLLKAFGYVDDRWFAPEHALRGQYVHRCIELYNAGKLKPGSVDDAIKPYFQAYLAWLRDSRFVSLRNEIMCYNSALHYAGIADLLGMQRGERTLVEICSSTAFPKWKIRQAIAYSFCRPARSIAGEELPKRIIGLCLKPSGRYSHIRITPDAQSVEVLRSMSLIYWDRERQ